MRKFLIKIEREHSNLQSTYCGHPNIMPPTAFGQKVRNKFFFVSSICSRSLMLGTLTAAEPSSPISEINTEFKSDGNYTPHWNGTHSHSELVFSCFPLRLKRKVSAVRVIFRLSASLSSAIATGSALLSSQTGFNRKFAGSFRGQQPRVSESDLLPEPPTRVCVPKNYSSLS